MLYTSTKNTNVFHDTVISLQYKNKEVFTTQIVLLLKWINNKTYQTKVSKTLVHKYNSNQGGNA